MNEGLDLINKVDGASPNFQTELAKQIAELAPEVVADGKIDVDKLKELLAGGGTSLNLMSDLACFGRARSALCAPRKPQPLRP